MAPPSTVRRKELERSIEYSLTRRQTLRDEVKSLEAKRDDFNAKLEEIKGNHSQACRLEALGQPNEREKIEKDIASMTARFNGAISLVSDKTAEIKRQDLAREPLEQELSRIVAAEKREKDLAEINQSFEEGKREIIDIISIQARLHRRYVKLHDGYADDRFVQNQAVRYAELLGNANNGLRVHETFTTAELERIQRIKKGEV